MKTITIYDRDVPFYLAFTLYFFTRYSEYLAINNAEIISCMSILKNISYLMCIAIILFYSVGMTKLYINRIVIYCIIISFVFYQVLTHNANSIFVVILFSIAFADGNLRRFLKYNYFLNLCCFIFTIISSFVGLTENVVTSTDKYNMIFTRSSLGFNYPGQLMMSLMPIIFLYYYLNDKKTSLCTHVFWMICAGIVFIFSQTIMPLMVILMFIILFIIYKNWSNSFYKVFQPYWMPFLSFFLTIALLILRLINNKFAIIIDNIANYRFSLGVTALKQYGISLLGSGFQNINDGIQYLILDSEYIFMLISNGVVYTVIAILLFTSVIKWAQVKKEKTLVLIFVLIALNGIFNNGIFNLIFNPFMIVLNQSIAFKSRENRHIVI